MTHGAHAHGPRLSLGRLCLLLILLGLPGPLAAQEPVVRLELSEPETIPGQSVSLRVTILAPTFLPDPPIWPSYEAPNLAVRVASTGPTSERIEGASWSGVTRRYLISPMVPGTFDLPAQTVTVTWADPDTNAPLSNEMATEPLTITGVLPPGAEGLEPFFAAEALELKQTVEGETEGIAPGASVVRSVTASVRGTPPMFLPALLPPHQIDGMRAYPDEAVLEESGDRGVISGSRTERVTLIAEGGGAGEAPAVSISWFNLRSGEVETATVEAIPITIDGPPAVSTTQTPRDWRAIGVSALALLLAVGVAALILRKLAPPLSSWIGRQWARWRLSEPVAFRALRSTVRERNHKMLYDALEDWAAKLPGHGVLDDPRLREALGALGAARYGPGPRGGGSEAGWRAVERVLPEVRMAAMERRKPAPLPPLNPDRAPTA